MDSKNQNANIAYKTRQLIFKALSDGQWHQNMELISTTKLNYRTLTKHLKKMTETQIIEKKKDIINGKRAVLFKTTTHGALYIDSMMFRKLYSDNIDKVLEESKDPLMMLNVIHNWSQLNFIQILKLIKNNIITNSNTLNYLEEFLLWDDYQYSTMKLIEATTKNIDKININELLMSQVIKQKEIAEKPTDTLMIKTLDNIIKLTHNRNNKQPTLNINNTKTNNQQNNFKLTHNNQTRR